MSEFDEKAAKFQSRLFSDKEYLGRSDLDHYGIDSAFQAGARWQFDQLKAELSNKEKEISFVNSKWGGASARLDLAINCIKEAQKSFRLSAKMATEVQELCFPGFETCDCEGGCGCKYPDGWMKLHDLEYHNLGSDIGVNETLEKIEGKTE